MDETHLYLLWTNDNPVTSEKMVFMYAVNALAHGWWEKVTLIVWGATARLAGEDEIIRKRISEALAAGVHITACKACADQLGVTESLRGMGIEVKNWGEPLTQILKERGHLLTI